MTDKEINRATITAFIARAINHASANAIDAEFGLRLYAATIERQGVRLEFADGRKVFICQEKEAAL